ncbi:MAG: class I SAM-dependent methyltransferase [Nocardioidaceae bacterium]
MDRGLCFFPTTGCDPSASVLSDLRLEDSGTAYDGRVALYDRLVGNGLYNRFVWGTSPGSYAAFAAAAVADSDGPLLDVGCGSALFTAGAYRGAGRRMVLVDRSLGMLARAADRLQGHDPERIAFVQADLLDLPFQVGSFSTRWPATGCCTCSRTRLRPSVRCARQLAPTGSLYATALVAETAVGGRALALLHRRGEAAAPRRAHELADIARTELGVAIRMHREGSMIFLTATP